MEHYAGIDVSLKKSSVCVVDAGGKVVREAKVSSEPQCRVNYFDKLDLAVVRIGLETGPLSQWLHAALIAAGREIVLLETRHVKAALSAMTVNTDRKDRKDVRGIAQLLQKYQSGETDRDGGVSKVGDAMVRTALFEAAHIMLTRATRFSSLKRRAPDAAQRRGKKRGGLRAEHGQDHDPGDEIVIQRDLTIKGPAIFLEADRFSTAISSNGYRHRDVG